MAETDGAQPMTTNSTSDAPRFSDDELIDQHADLIAEIVQNMTNRSETARYDLKLALAEFADEIIRQAVEP